MIKENLNGYCDYTACRKFNHRYLSSDAGKKQQDIFFVHSGGPIGDIEEMNVIDHYPIIKGDGFMRFSDGKIPCLLLCHTMVSRNELGGDESEEHIKEIALPRILKEYGKIRKAGKIIISFTKNYSYVNIESIDADMTDVQVNNFSLSIGEKTITPESGVGVFNPSSQFISFSGDLNIKKEITLKAPPTVSDLIVNTFPGRIDVWCVVSDPVPVTIDISLTVTAENQGRYEEYFLTVPSHQPTWTGTITPQRYVITFWNDVII